jgi:predicted branched-subunit amino acid permease
MMSRNVLSRALLLPLSLVVVVNSAGSEIWFAGPAVLLALFGLQIKSSKSAEITYASLAAGEILVIIVGLSSIPLALIAQIIVLMLAGLNLPPITNERIAGDSLVNIIIGITAGTVVLVLEDVYLVLLVIICVFISMLVFVLFNEKQLKRISERTNA